MNHFSKTLELSREKKIEGIQEKEFTRNGQSVVERGQLKNSVAAKRRFKHFWERGLLIRVDNP